MPDSLFFNTQHSPIGAFASFTLGARGAKGGLAVELGKPADQNIYIGLESTDGTGFSCLPFFDTMADEKTRFDVSAETTETSSALKVFADGAISRELTPGRDRWIAGSLDFSIYTPVCPAPDPASSKKSAQMLAYAPSLAVEVVIDNRKSRKPRRFIFGYQGNDPSRSMRCLDGRKSASFTGIGCGSTAIVTRTPDVHTALAFTPEDALTEANPFNRKWGLGTVGLLIGKVPAKVKKTFRFCVCFHRAGIVTTGLDASYYYGKFFPDMESVAAYSLTHFRKLRDRGLKFDRRVAESQLSAPQKFMLSQAIHSYYGSTELLAVGRRPLWVVNEGEYRMMNTFDLTVDQVYFEMELNPWTVANELDWFLRRYAYTDKTRFPGQRQNQPGGLSFTHDMGVANHFSAPGRSAYEKADLDGCFSHMTHEELVNWVACGLIYEAGTRDAKWLKRSLPTFERCLESLLNRDHHDPAERDGVMSLDSSRCQGGSEITTYDSLDVSLGQARHNLYLAVRCWGIYVGLAALFRRAKKIRPAEVCEKQAELAAATISASADEDGFLPAILFEDVASRIIPAIEGLVLPYQLGLREALEPKGPYGHLIAALKRHLENVLKPGICLFPDGGWKISSTSDNSWLSKIYLAQFIADRILGLANGKQRKIADQAHCSWLRDPRNSYWAWSDQMVKGIALGSKYYPRGVTSILWLEPPRSRRSSSVSEFFRFRHTKGRRK